MQFQAGLKRSQGIALLGSAFYHLKTIIYALRTQLFVELSLPYFTGQIRSTLHLLLLFRSPPCRMLMHEANPFFQSRGEPLFAVIDQLGRYPVRAVIPAKARQLAFIQLFFHSDHWQVGDAETGKLTVLGRLDAPEFRSPVVRDPMQAQSWIMLVSNRSYPISHLKSEMLLLQCPKTLDELH
jgi:hypothetical protein